MKPRVLVPVVIILGLCWLGLTSLSLSGGSAFAKKLTLQATGATRLRERLMARLPVSAMVLRSGDPSMCVLNASRLVVPAPGGCVYAIQPDSGKTRRLSLSLNTSSLLVQLVLIQPGYLTVKQTLTAGDSIDLDIFQNDQAQAAELRIVECMITQPEQNAAIPEPNSGCVLEIKK